MFFTVENTSVRSGSEKGNEIISIHRNHIYTIVNYTLVRPKLDYCFAGWHPVPLMYKKPWKRFKLGSYDPCTSKIITQIITLFDLVSAERFLFLFVNNQIIEKKWENSSNDFYRFIEEILLFHSFYI